VPFCAGLIAKDGRVVHAAPILRWMIGMDGGQFFDHCAHRLWRFEVCG